MNDWLNLIWPLCFVLGALLVFWLGHKLGDNLQPIAASLASGLAEFARKNAVPCVVAFLYGVSASLMAFAEVFQTLGRDEWQAMTWHQYGTMWAKVLNPFIIAVLAYWKQPNFSSNSAGGGTNPPIPR